MIKPLLFFVMFTIFVGKAHAQQILGAATLGLNTTQVEGDEVWDGLYGFAKFGLNVGAAAIIPFNDRWSVSLETMYTEKGGYQRPRFTKDRNGAYMLRLNYAEVPLLIHFEDRETMTFGLGSSWGRLVHMEEYEHQHLIPWQTLSGPYEINDFNVVIDLRFRVYERFWGNLRLQHSLVPIRQREFSDVLGNVWTRDQYNQIISFRILYIFNENIEPDYEQ